MPALKERAANESRAFSCNAANSRKAAFFMLRLAVLLGWFATSSLAECSSSLESAAQRTNVLYVLLGLAGATAVGSCVYWRLSRYATTMRVRLDERMQERNRIARDLHDTLLQTIQFSKMVADDAQEEPADPERMQIALRKLSEWLGRASEEGRAALDSLRVATIHADDLTAAFERVLVECRLRAEVQAAVSVKGAPVDLHPMIHDELFRIGYEAIHNACAHAMATSINVELDYRKSFTMRVVDDGIGIDVQVLAKGKKGHYGIVGMQERAVLIGGKLFITSSSKGTRVVLSIPHRG